MILGHQHDEALLDGCQRLHGGIRRRPKHQGEIDTVIHEFGDGVDVIEHADIEVDLAVPCAKFRDHPRQEIERQRLAAGNAHGAAAKTAQILDVRPRAFQFRALLANVADKHLAGGGEAHAARLALEQRRAEFGLKVHDPAVDRGSGDIEPAGGAPDRAGASDRIDILKDSRVAHGSLNRWLRSGRCRRWCKSDAFLATREPEISGAQQWSGGGFRHNHC